MKAFEVHLRYRDRNEEAKESTVVVDASSLPGAVAKAAREFVGTDQRVHRRIVMRRARPCNAISRAMRSVGGDGGWRRTGWRRLALGRRGLARRRLGLGRVDDELYLADHHRVGDVEKGVRLGGFECLQPFA